MIEIAPGLLIPVGVALILLLILGWSMHMQRRALIRQREAIDTVEESMGMQRQARELLIEGNAFAEQSLRNQEEMIRLLRVLAPERGSAEISTTTAP